MNKYTHQKEDGRRLTIGWGEDQRRRHNIRSRWEETRREEWKWKPKRILFWPWIWFLRFGGEYQNCPLKSPSKINLPTYDTLTKIPQCQMGVKGNQCQRIIIHSNFYAQQSLCASSSNNLHLSSNKKCWIWRHRMKIRHLAPSILLVLQKVKVDRKVKTLSIKKYNFTQYNSTNDYKLVYKRENLTSLSIVRKR